MMDICPKCSVAVLDLVEETNGEREIPDLSLLRVDVKLNLLNVKRYFCSLAVYWENVLILSNTCFIKQAKYLFNLT